MKVFIFDNVRNRINVNTPEILLVREFKALWDQERNKCKEDPTGELRMKAFREFTYIWLALDWLSPYSEYSEYERHEECLQDAQLTPQEFDDPLFRAACRKYRAMQEESWALKCLRSAQNMASKFIDYFTNIDPEERDTLTGKPIFKVRDIMTEITKLAELNDTLKTLEYQVKKEKEAEVSNRGGESDGFIPSDTDFL